MMASLRKEIMWLIRRAKNRFTELTFFLLSQVVTIRPIALGKQAHPPNSMYQCYADEEKQAQISSPEFSHKTTQNSFIPQY